MIQLNRLNKFTVIKCQGLYCLNVCRNGHSIDVEEKNIAKIFKGVISPQKYYSILRKHNGEKIDSWHWFKTKQDAVNALTELEQYIIIVLLKD
ncbi:MAG: hypothetical protein WCJ62_13645 [Flavobacterium sp.]